MENINICYVITGEDNYIDLTLKSMTYIKKTFKNSKYKLKFFVISEEKIKLPSFIKNIISPYKGIPILWQRMYIPELLNVKKCIFLDSDTITLSCISKLWETNLNGNIVGVVESHFLKLTDKIPFYKFYKLDYKPYNEVKNFFNCGVQVIDCKKWLIDNISEKMLTLYLELLNVNHYSYKMDEPVFSTVLQDKIQKLDKKWNFLPVDNSIRPAIIHYYGRYSNNKPNPKFWGYEDINFNKK